MTHHMETEVRKAAEKVENEEWRRHDPTGLAPAISKWHTIFFNPTALS